MTIKITVRLSSGSYHARALRLGVTASSAEGARSAAVAVCRKLDIDPGQLEQVPDSATAATFTHPNQTTPDNQRSDQQ